MIPWSLGVHYSMHRKFCELRHGSGHARHMDVTHPSFFTVCRSIATGVSPESAIPPTRSLMTVRDTPLIVQLRARTNIRNVASTVKVKKQAGHQSEVVCECPSRKPTRNMAVSKEKNRNNAYMFPSLFFFFCRSFKLSREMHSCIND